MISRIVTRFPNYSGRVVEALDRDQVMAELCRDYDAVLADLEMLEQGYLNNHRLPRSLHRELVRLKTELENEVLERLASHSDSSGTEKCT